MTDQIYLNNATTGYPILESALAEFIKTSRQIPSDIRHSQQPQIEIARNKIANILNVDAECLFFVADATIGINCVINGYLNKDDSCIIDNRIHNSISRSLHGAPSINWHIAPLYDLNENIIKSELRKVIELKPKLLCLTHTCNVTGSVYDVSETIKYIRKNSPQTAILLDACQTIGFMKLDNIGDPDFIVFPGHKYLHSVHGASVLVAKKRLTQVIFGGTGVNSENLSFDHYSQNFVEVGTANIAAINALVLALEEFYNQSEVISKTIEVATEKLWKGLVDIENITPLGRSPFCQRSGIIACKINGHSEQDWMPYLRSSNIIARGGLHCCPSFHQQFDINLVGTLRFSVSRFTKPAEIEKTIEAVSCFAKILSPV